MASVLRTIGSIVAALTVAFVLVIAVELLSAVVHPVPEGFSGTMEEMCKHVERYPHWVLAVAAAAWAGTAFASTWLAGRLGNRVSALFVGLLLLVAAIANILMLPYTTWFKVVCPLMLGLAVALGIRWSSRRKAPADPSTS